MFRKTAFVPCCLPEAAASETITFDIAEDVMIHRDGAGDARFEFLADGDSRLQCVALNSGNAPISVENIFANTGFIRFHDIEVAQIARAVCRRRN
ncbi:hypothetical protein Q4577_19980 [Marinovum sp. 2_MG-2023]|uniref:hypothetical protein n=1 Tax=unclassified Marinovum TaxID=2647166 RepID=UPI0026E462A1|nr:MULTISPECIES: hypothetical protein [unclassified Marinovum]MDO6732317.1 hypothetical protein [Marinovum sp. 2_MG-2023]MDO6781634.1 hypothetical protein [Marinovum sp. 1_MG-2023]